MAEREVHALPDEFFSGTCCFIAGVDLVGYTQNLKLLLRDNYSIWTTQFTLRKPTKILNRNSKDITFRTFTT